MKKLLLAIFTLVTILAGIIGCTAPVDTPKGGEETGNSGGIISAEERQRIELYLTVLKAAFYEENGGNRFVAIKLDTLVGLSDEGKQEVLRELTDLSPNVYSFEEVNEDNTKFAFDDRGRLRNTIDGTLLWLEVKDYNEKQSIITAVSWFGNLGAVFPQYEATYKDGKWHLKLISMAVS